SGDGDWGPPTTLPWGVAYPNGTVPWPYAPGVCVHPAAIYEMLTLIGIFALLLGVRSRTAQPGTTFVIYLVLSATARFLLQFFRTNPTAFLGLTEAQWTSIALTAGAALWLLRGVAINHPFLCQIPWMVHSQGHSSKPVTDTAG